MAQQNNPSIRCPFISRSDGPMDISEEIFCRMNRGEAEPKDLSRTPCLSQTCDRGRAKPSPSPVCAAHAEFVAALAGHPPRPIPVEADGIDLEDRAAHLGKVFIALSVYMALILDDTAQNAPGNLDLPDVEAHLTDLASDVVGIIERAAEDMPWRMA